MKRTVLLVFCLTLVSCTACSSAPTQGYENIATEAQVESEPPTVLKIGCQSAEDSSEVRVLKYFEQLVEERSKHALDIQIFPSSALGPVGDMAEGVSLGTIEMAAIGFNSYATYCSDFAIYDLWSFHGPEDFVQLYESEVGKKLNSELLTSSGIRILTYNLCSPGQLYFWGNKEIRTVDDYNGLRVRTNGLATVDFAIAAFGGIPTAVSWTDMYSALQTKVIDVGFGDVENLLTSGYGGIVTYRYTGLENYLGSSVCISEKVWQSLSGELQIIIEKALKEACQDFARKVYEEKVRSGEESLRQTGIETLTMDPAEKDKMALIIREASEAYLNTVVLPEILEEAKPYFSTFDG